MTITSEEARARTEGERIAMAIALWDALAGDTHTGVPFDFRVPDDLVKRMYRLADAALAHQSPSRAAGGVDYRAEFEAALIARDEAGYLGTSPAETIRALSEELRATPAELPALPSREEIARLCERMSEQLANWEEEEGRDDWWAYQRDYAKAHAILAALHPPASVAEVEGLREVGAVTVACALLEPFVRLAGPINGEAGRPTYLEAISGPNGTDELQLSTYVGDGQRIEILSAADFRALRAAVCGPSPDWDCAKECDKVGLCFAACNGRPALCLKAALSTPMPSGEKG